MFHFRRIDPDPVLREYVKGYWLIRKETKGNEIPLRLIPDGYPELMFHLSRPFSFEINQKRSVLPQSCLLGQATGVIQVEAEQGASAFFVKMYPWVPFLLFDIPQKEFVNQQYDLESLGHSPGMKDLATRIRSANSFTEAVQVMENFLIRKVHLQEKKQAVLALTTQQIIVGKGRVSIEELGKNIKWSSRYLEQLFQKGLGLSPKRFSRIIRNKEVTRLMTESPPANLGAFALEMGYFDQAHFIKDFKSITEQTPTGFMNYMQNFPIREMDVYFNQFV